MTFHPISHSVGAGGRPTATFASSTSRLRKETDQMGDPGAYDIEHSGVHMGKKEPMSARSGVLSTATSTRAKARSIPRSLGPTVLHHALSEVDLVNMTTHTSTQQVPALIHHADRAAFCRPRPWVVMCERAIRPEWASMIEPRPGEKLFQGGQRHLRRQQQQPRCQLQHNNRCQRRAREL